MSGLSTLFEQFLRERPFLKNVTPKTVTWYQTAFDSLTRTVSVPDPAHLTKAVCRIRRAPGHDAECTTARQRADRAAQVPDRAVQPAQPHRPARRLDTVGNGPGAVARIPFCVVR
jgi:hypothetical protein